MEQQEDHPEAGGRDRIEKVTGEERVMKSKFQIDDMRFTASLQRGVSCSKNIYVSNVWHVSISKLA